MHHYVVIGMGCQFEREGKSCEEKFNCNLGQGRQIDNIRVFVAAVVYNILRISGLR